MQKSFWLVALLGSHLLVAQSPKILPKNINHPSYNSVYPAVSADGKVMLFMSDYSDDGAFIMTMSEYRSGKWQTPQDLDVLGSSKVNNWGGYTLNYDGTAIYFSSRRSDGVGAFDIWYAKKEKGKWTTPKNMGKPINSAGHEGNPSISPDGQRMYFMRCKTMTPSRAEGCKLYYSEKGPRGWQQAVELPAHLNKGNATSPRILPDNKTLVFASDRPGGKGGVDLWMSRRTGDHWSEPVNIAPVNSAENDYFLSVTMRSLAFYTTLNDKGQKVIAELRLPRAYRLENVIVQQGSVKDATGNPLTAEVRAYNIDEHRYEARVRTGREGNFIVIIPAGGRYDVSYSEIRLNKLYRAELVNTLDLVAPRREYPNIILPELTAGTTFRLNLLRFKPYTTEIDDMATQEISRLARLLKRYPTLQINIGAYQKNYLEDSVATVPDLTEVRTDTIIVYEPAIRVDTLANEQKDSLLVAINHSLAATTSQDTTMTGVFLARMAATDSVAVEKAVAVYHNNRTPAEAEAVKARLVENGIAPERIQATGYKDEQPPVEFPPGVERMVVIRLLNDPHN